MIPADQLAATLKPVGCPVHGLRALDLNGPVDMCGDCRVLGPDGKPLGWDDGKPSMNEQTTTPDPAPAGATFNSELKVQTTPDVAPANESTLEQARDVIRVGQRVEYGLIQKIERIEAELARVRPVVDAAREVGRLIPRRWRPISPEGAALDRLDAALAGLGGDTATPQPAAVDVPAAIRADEAQERDALDDGWRPSPEYLSGYRAGVERSAEVAAEALATPSTDTPPQEG